MSQLGLGVACCDFSAESGLQDQLILLLVAEVLQRLDEHESVERERRGVAEDGGLEVLIGPVQGKVTVKLDHFLGVGSHHVGPGLVKDAGVEPHDWVVGDQSEGLLKLIEVLLAGVEEVGELQLVEGSLFSLQVEHRYCIGMM